MPNRDTFRLLLCFSEKHLKKPAANLHLSDIDASLVFSFLNHLENQRNNCIRSRNARLAAIHSFMHYTVLQEPAALAGIQQVLAIPLKRFDRAIVSHLTPAEIQAILAAPDKSTWSGRRDYVLLTTLYNSGARVSDLSKSFRPKNESFRGRITTTNGCYKCS